MKRLKKRVPINWKTSSGNLKRSNNIERTFKNLLIDFGTTQIVLALFRVKLNCLRSCKFYKSRIENRVANWVILSSRPELKPVEKEVEVVLKFPDVEALSPPILQLSDITFGYTPEVTIFSNVTLNATLESRICIVSFCFIWGAYTNYVGSYIFIISGFFFLR